MNSKTENQNIKLIKRFFEEVFNHRKISTLYELMPPDCINHFEHDDLKGPEEYEKKFLNVFFYAIPDVYTEIDDIVAKDDKVVVKWTAYGNFLNEFFGVQPTGGKFKYSGIVWTKIKDRKAVESWTNWNMSFLFRQLFDEVNTLRGIIPICTKC